MAVTPIVGLCLPPHPGRGIEWAPPAEWSAEEALAEAARLGALPAVIHNLRALDRGPAGDSAWTDRLRRNYAHNLNLQRQETGLVERLNRAGVDCRPIKGPGLVELLYPDLSWRGIADIDLLIRPEQVEQAYRLLKQWGLKDAAGSWTGVGLARLTSEPDDFFPELVLVAPPATIVELHWDWVGESFPAGSPVQDREAFLLYLCRHGAKHFWASMQRVCDIELYLRKFGEAVDWKRFWTLARNKGWERAAAASLEICAVLFGRAPHQYQRRPRLWASRAMGRQAARLLLAPDRPWWWRHQVTRRLRVYSWSQRLRRCAGWIQPPPWHWNLELSNRATWVRRYRRLALAGLALACPLAGWRRRLRKSVDLEGRDWWILLRAAVLLAVVRAGLGVVSFETWRRWAQAPRAAAETIPGQVERIAWLVEAAANHHVLRMTCLPRSLVLLRLLTRLGAPAELKLGVRQHQGRLQAHAWVEWQGRALNQSGRQVDFAELAPARERRG